MFLPSCSSLSETILNSSQHVSEDELVRKVSADCSRLLYLSLRCHLLLGVRKLLLKPGGERRHHRLLLLGVSFRRDFLLLV